jgi:hypothetical protein
LDTIKYKSFTRINTDLIMKNSNAMHGARKQPRKHVYVYHWNRIIGAGLVFLVLGGLAVYGLFLWSDSSHKEEFDMAKTLPKAKVVAEDTRSRLEEEPIHREIKADPQPFNPAEEDRLPPAVAETTDSNSNLQKTQTPLLNEAITAEDNLAQQFAKNKPLETEPSSPKKAQLSTANPTNKETVEETSEPQGERPDSADRTLTVDTLNRHFQLKKLEILEPSVKRFLLARSVSNKEPKGELNEISFTADGIAAVWAYSEVIDKKGSRFKYVWLHGGKQITTVPVNVGGNRWRSYSSKLINRSMSGAWRVELQDGEGRLMASVDFFLE